MPVYYSYVLILVACFIAARLILWGLPLHLKQKVVGIEATYRTWVVIVAMCMTTIALGREAMILGLTIVSLLGLHEYHRATSLYETPWYPSVVNLFASTTGGLILLSCFESALPCFEWYQSLPWLSLCVLLLVAILTNRAKGQLARIAMAFFGYFYFAWMLLHVAWIARCVDGQKLLLFLLFSVGVADIAAFTFGKALGRHPLCQQISPRKTWEGLAGAVFVSSVLACLLRFSFSSSVTFVQVAWIGLLIGVGTQLGDLVLSMIKRDLDRKDMGTLLPGHGGVLDRIDSLIFVAPLYYYSLSYFGMIPCVAPTS